ncbi:MAG: hypothetical protein JSV03_10305 [Planctomycetota bacterium]|nr:MAG: hypothetical protein JSV03_10305 [Planctomycetota bacterium]
MRKFKWIIALVVFVDVAWGDIWIGNANLTGPVPRPKSYQEAVKFFNLDKLNFDNFQSGSMLNHMNLGKMIMYASPGYAGLTVRHNTAAGAEPASWPGALEVDEAISGPTDLKITMNQPVQSIGFVMMGLDVRGYLKIYGDGDVLLGDYSISSALPGERRWIGVVNSDWDIWKVHFEPIAADCYAIDDLELGVVTPEPA